MVLIACPMHLPHLASICALLLTPAISHAKVAAEAGLLLTPLDKIEVAIIDGPARDGVLELSLMLESSTDLSARIPAIRARLQPECMEFARIEASRHRAVNVPLLHRRLNAALDDNFPEVSGILIIRAWVRPQ